MKNTAKPLEKNRAVKKVCDEVAGLPYPGHGFGAGKKIAVVGTRNYDGLHRVLATSTTDQIHIKADHKKETMRSCSATMLEDNAAAFRKFSQLRFHDLRHTYASLLIDQRENVKYIQSRLGHWSPMVTLNVYAHLMEPANQAAACRLEDAIFGKGKA